MIVTSRPQTRINPKAYPIGSNAKAPYVGTAYQLFKHASKVYGFYGDIKPYLPDTYLDYKPHKRLTGYAGKRFHAKKKIFRTKFRKNASCQFNQKYCVRWEEH